MHRCVWNDSLDAITSDLDGGRFDIVRLDDFFRAKANAWQEHFKPWAKTDVFVRVFVGIPNQPNVQCGGVLFSPESHDEWQWQEAIPDLQRGYTGDSFGPCE